jgi:uncharacterized membrane protein YphA (DoxX/SURF4 family)
MPGPALSEVTIAIRALLALVFLTAAVGKMRHWTAFQGVIVNYRLLPESLLAPFAYFLPPLEALLGTALLIRLFSPWTEFAAGALLLLFAVAMGINLRRGRRYIDCGCFQSALKQSLSWHLVARNVVMVLLLGVALILKDGSGDLAMQVQGLMVGAVSFLILQSLNILWGIVPAWRQRQIFGSEAAP